MLLDDGNATGAAPTSRLYLDPVRTLACADPGELDAVWAEVEAAQRGGLHAFLLADYEWGARLVGAGERAPGAGAPGRAPALRVLLFRELYRLDRAAVDAWLASAEGCASPAPAGPMHLRASRDGAGFARDVDRIQAHLRAGDTYQVNHTLRLDFQVHGSPLSLYRRLRARQAVPFGALAALDDGGWVLSCSPELFVRLDGAGGDRRLVVRPMKGTAPLGRAAGGPLADRKTQAENVMIVDLLRNDLGRVAATGSVQVQRLFTVEDYPTLQQLTSTIEARPREGLRFPDVLRAMFPCGSVTGAPKHRTMQLIAALEGTPRGLYCGALGWVDAPAPGATLGDFCLSVAIRTVELGALPPEGGPRPGRLGVGAGIVLGSRADAEHAETLLKAAFLTDLDPGFELLETLRMEADGRLPLLADHLARLGASARTFGFPWEPADLEESLRTAVGQRTFTGPGALRLTLARDGRREVALRALELPWEPAPGAEPVVLGLDPVPLEVDPVRSRHKTTWRPRYDAGLALARDRGWFDVLFLDGAGRLVEGARSSLFVKRDGHWITPPLDQGALPGVQRARLLADPAWGAREGTVTLADLRRAEGLMVCNALRGPLPARLEAPLEEGPPGAFSPQGRA